MANLQWQQGASNVIDLRWSEVNLVQRIAWVKAENSKSGKAIAVPLNDDALHCFTRANWQA